MIGRPPAAAATAAPAVAPGRSRDNPAQATFPRTLAPQQAGLGERDLARRVRLAARVRLRRRRFLRHFSDERPCALADAVIAAIGAPADFPIGGRTLREVLIDGVSLGAGARHAVPAFLLHHRRRAAKEGEALAAGEDPDGDAATLDVLAAIQKFPASGPIRKPSSRRSTRCSRGSTRSPPRPRPIRAASRCIDAVRYPVDGRTRLGVASTFLADRVSPGDKIKVYVQKAQHFALPADPRCRSS